MKACPDKKNEEYIKLEDAFGKGRALISFVRKGDGSIPTIEEAEKLLGVKANEGPKEFKDWLKDEPYTRPNFIQTVNEKAKGIINSAKDMSKSFIQSIVPSFAQKQFMADETKTILRKNLGELNRKNTVQDEASKATMNFWNKVSFNEKMHFINAMENPRMYDMTGYPEYQKFMDEYKTRMDNVYKQLKEIKDVPYFEDYFPHFWEKPEKAQKFFSNANLGKKPLEGSKSFLRQRFFADIKAGIDAGFELITDNPEEIVRIAEMNALKFKMSHDVFKTFDEIGWLKYVRAGETPPEGFELVKDPLFQRMSPYAKKVSEAEVAMAAEFGAGIKPEAGLAAGAYYLPEDAARILNNYLSRGLAGIKGVRHVYHAATYINNLKNTFQLGFSGFHFVTTSVDASITTSSNGLNRILTGKPKNILEGLKMMAEGYTMLPAISKNYAKANSVIGDFLGGKLSDDVERLSSVNARVKGERQWQINAEYNFKKSINKFKGGELIQGLPAVYNALMVIPEYAAKPIMEYHVPRMKVAGYLKSVENELALRPGMDANDIQKMKERIWDDMDDRLGQVVYDNLFWDKTMKDLSFMTIRSFGWTGGTIRAIGKGILDLPESGRRIVKGEGISPRTAWLINLPIQVGLYGAMLHYLFTGQQPQEIKDYFFPKDGTKNPDGTDRRITLPTYMKDVFSYQKAPFKTLKNKTSPFLNEALEIYNNQDFYKQPIFDEDDEFYKQGLDILGYELKSFEPFGFRKQPGAEQPLLSQQSIESKVGLTQAPSEFTRTDLEEAVNEQLVKEMDKARRMPDYSPEKSAYKKILAERSKEGLSFSEMSLEEKQKAGLVDARGRIIKPDAVARFMRTSMLTNAQRGFKYLTPEGQLKVVSKLNDEQYDELLPKGKRQLIYGIKALTELARTKPEFFKTQELKDAYKKLTKRDFREQENNPE